MVSYCLKIKENGRDTHLSICGGTIGRSWGTRRSKRAGVSGRRERVLSWCSVCGGLTGGGCLCALTCLFCFSFPPL